MGGTTGRRSTSLPGQPTASRTETMDGLFDGYRDPVNGHAGLPAAFARMAAIDFQADQIIVFRAEDLREGLPPPCP